MAIDTIKSSAVLDGAIATADIADDAVTTAKITDANITTAKVADGAVTTAKITDANITTAKVADDAITSAKLDTNIAIDGKLGIGDSTVLGNKVHIRTGGSATSVNASAGLVLEDDDNTRCDLQFMGPNGAFHSILFGDVSDDDIGRISYSHSGNNMRFTVNAAERMRIDSSGRVSIGTTVAHTADSLLTLQNSGGSAELNITSGTSGGSVLNMGDTGDFNIGRIKYDQSTNSMQFNTNNAERMRIDSSGQIIAGAFGGNSTGIFRASSSPGYTNQPGSHLLLKSGDGSGTGSSFMSFSTSQGGSSGSNINTAVERCRINAVGSFLIGTTAQYGAKLNIVFNGSGASPQGDYRGITITPTATNSTTYLHFHNTGVSTIGSITGNGSNIAFNTSSDYRLKENVNYTFDATTQLKKLKPCKFNFIGQEQTIEGFLAHEVQDVVPLAIHGKKDQVDKYGNAVMQGIDQSKLVPLLTKTLQEALTEIDSLKARLDDAGL